MKPIRQQLKEAFRWKGLDSYRNFTLALIAGLAILYGVIFGMEPSSVRSPFDLKVVVGCFALAGVCVLLASNRVLALGFAVMVPAALMFYDTLFTGDRKALAFCLASFSVGLLILVLGTLAKSLWQTRSSRWSK